MKNKIFSTASAAQRGFTIVELLIAVSISAVLATYAMKEYNNFQEEKLATAAGNYIASVAEGTKQHVLLNFNSYANALPVPGVAAPLQPTVPEIVTLGRLPNGFANNRTVTNQNLQINITPVNCPGATCQVNLLVCTTTPINFGRPQTRFDLASTMVSVQNGSGAQSLQGNGALIRGPLFNPGVPNPIGNVEGIVCGTSAVDLAMFQNFVQFADTRDPNLQGDLTVGGTVTAKSQLNVGNCIKMDGTAAGKGRAGFGCTNGADLPAGFLGGVRTPDLVASVNVLTSSTPGAYTGAPGQNYSLITSNNGAGRAEIKTSGRSIGDIIMPTGTFGDGVACNAADDGAIAKRLNFGSGLVVCQNGTWRPLAINAAKDDACAVEGSRATGPNGVGLLCINQQYRPMNELLEGAVPGSACARPGSTGVDTNNFNETLLCRANPDPGGGGPRWFRMRDLVSNFSFVRSIEVGPGTSVAKPNCAPAAGTSAFPILQLIPKTFSSPDAGFAIYADNGATWTVQLRDGLGVSMPPGSAAVAHIYCYYP